MNMREIIKHSSVTLLVRIIGMLSGYLLILYIGKVYGADSLGVYSLSVTILTLFGMLSTLGIDKAALRYLSENMAINSWQTLSLVYRKGMMIVLAASLATSLLLYIFHNPIVSLFFSNNNSDDAFLYVVMAVPPFVMLMYHAECIRAYNGNLLYVALKSLSVTSVPLIILMFVGKLQPAGVGNLAVYAYFWAIVLASLFAFAYWNRRVVIHYITDDKSDFSSMDFTRVGVTILFASLLNFMVQWTDTLMLGAIKNEYQVGLYNAAYKVSTLITIGYFAVNTVVTPKFSTLFSKGDMSGLEKLAKNATRLSLVVSLPIMIILVVFAEYCMSLFGTEFMEAVPALLILAVGQFVSAGVGSVLSILVMCRQEKNLKYVTLFAALLNVVLNYVLIPEYGINGAAISTSVSLIALNISSLFLVRVKIGFWLFGKTARA